MKRCRLALMAAITALSAPCVLYGDEPITGDALELASAAALEYTGGGRVTETEVGDEDGYYEVEVTLAGGQQIDVHLDADFKVISAEGDDESDDEEDGSDDD